MGYDGIGRRLPYSRCRRNFTLEIGDRDIEVLRLLARYRYLRRDFLHRLMNQGNEQWLTRRLRTLFDARYINRPPEQWRALNARYSATVYELDDLGEQLLRDRDLYPREISRLVRKGRSGAIRQYPHSMMICDTLASIEIGLQNTDAEIVTWSEILDRAGKLDHDNPFKLPCEISYTYTKTGKRHFARTHIIPDAVFGIRQGDRASFFALEAERGNGVWRNNLNQPSFLKKVLAYRDIIRNKTHINELGIPNLRVLVVTGSPARVQTMIDLATEVTGGSNLFLFHDIPTHDHRAPKPFPDLVENDWSRAGREPTNLLQR